jgi:acyl-CoA thioesterase-1
MAFGLRKVTVALAAVLAASTLAQAALLNIVAIGASNTSGWGVGEANAYPARLEALLREKGYDVRVTNAGVPFQTTVGMLERIDSAVPDGTGLVILQPGSNDKRFIVTLASRCQHRRDGEAAGRTRIKVIEPIRLEWRLISGLHPPSNEGHAWAAAALLRR